MLQPLHHKPPSILLSLAEAVADRMVLVMGAVALAA
jgi:hypothetical protein